MSNNELDKIVELMALHIGQSKDERRDDVSRIFDDMKQQLSNLIKEIIGKTNDNYLDMTIEDLLAVQRGRATNLGFNIGKDSDDKIDS